VKKIKKPIKVSKTPPVGWPSEERWRDVERKLSKGLASKVLPANASPVERAKQDICSHFVRYVNASGITQRELARELGVAESRVSEILHYHHARFTIDKLLDLLSRVKPEVRLKIA
jgi:predicted XRE-type DNA-binding protein